MTFLLLQITAKFAKKRAVTWRFILSSAIGGLYSFVILLPELPFFVTVLSKLSVAVIIMLAAFSYHRVSSFGLALLIFLFSNFVFLGIIVGIYLITNSKMIAVNNSSIYFDISARGLLASAFFAYLLSCLIVKIHNRSLSKNEILTLEIISNGKSVTLFALADTGNRLREPFSNSPVIVADRRKIEPILSGQPIRYIPSETVNGSSMLSAFKPEQIVVKSSKGGGIVENAYVALSDEMNSNNFSAVINPEILSV